MLEPFTAEQSARMLIEEMAYDNGGGFGYSPETFQKLVDACQKFTNNGERLDELTCYEIATGEVTELEETFGHIEGYEELNNCLNKIFNGDG